jgi:hypothetical protein
MGVISDPALKRGRWAQPDERPTIVAALALSLQRAVDFMIL